MTNLVTTVGLRQALKMALGVSGGTAAYYLAVGTGAAVAPTVASTALVTALAGHFQLTNAVNANVATLEGFLTNSQGIGTLTEWGLFDSVLTMLGYGQFTPSVVKTAANTLTVTVTATLVNS